MTNNSASWRFYAARPVLSTSPIPNPQLHTKKAHAHNNPKISHGEICDWQLKINETTMQQQLVAVREAQRALQK